MAEAAAGSSHINAVILQANTAAFGLFHAVPSSAAAATHQANLGP
jgi:hypothetical protein